MCVDMPLLLYDGSVLDIDNFDIMGTFQYQAECVSQAFIWSGPRKIFALEHIYKYIHGIALFIYSSMQIGGNNP